ncbi:MAG: adenine phosphoribosyltransferase, partial [Thermoplasmata archaeon]|nr:adenine phosphoribosyltransferase [Thermoplasmata archaeon]
MKEVLDLIRDVPDFPIPGIVFKDITPVLNNPEAFDMIIEELYERNKNNDIQGIVGIESRGFIIGA